MLKRIMEMRMQMYQHKMIRILMKKKKYREQENLIMVERMTAKYAATYRKWKRLLEKTV